MTGFKPGGLHFSPVPHAGLWDLLRISQPVRCHRALRKAYLREVLCVHPDVSADDTGRRFRELTRAYAILDAHLRRGSQGSPSESPQLPHRLFENGWTSWEDVNRASIEMCGHKCSQDELLRDYAALLTHEKQFGVAVVPVDGAQRYTSVRATEIKRQCEWSRRFVGHLRQAIPGLIGVVRAVVGKRRVVDLPRSPKPLLLLGEVHLRVENARRDHNIKIFESSNGSNAVQPDFRIFDLSAHSLAQLEAQTISYWNLRTRVEKSLRLLGFVFHDLVIAKHLDWKSQSVHEMDDEVISLENLTDSLVSIAGQAVVPSDENNRRNSAVQWYRRQIRRIRSLFRSRFLESVILRGSRKAFADGIDLGSGNALPSPTAIIAHNSQVPFEVPDDPFSLYKITRCRSSSLSSVKFNVHIQITGKATSFVHIMHKAAKAFQCVIKSRDKAVDEIAKLKKGISPGFLRSFIRFFFFTIAEEVLFWKRLSLSPHKDFSSPLGCDVYRHRHGVFEMVSDLPPCDKDLLSWESWWHEPLEGKTDCPSVVLDHHILQSQERFDSWLHHVLFCNLSYQQCESYRRKAKIEVVVRRGSLCISMDQVYAFLGNFASSVCRTILEVRTSPRPPVIRVVPSTSLVFVNEYGEIFIPWNATATELSCTLAARAMSKALPAPK